MRAKYLYGFAKIFVKCRIFRTLGKYIYLLFDLNMQSILFGISHLHIQALLVLKGPPQTLIQTALRSESC